MRCSDKHHTDPSAEPAIWKENLPAELIADAQPPRFKKKFAARRSKIVYKACKRVHVGSMMSCVEGKRVFLGAGCPLAPPAKLQLSTLCTSSQSRCSLNFRLLSDISHLYPALGEKAKKKEPLKNIKFQVIKSSTWSVFGFIYQPFFFPWEKRDSS